MPELKKKPKNDEVREIKYPTVKVELCHGKSAITAERAKELLGWTVVDSKTKEDDFLLTDFDGNKIVCTNNDHNREFDPVHSKKIAQDILNRNYKFNGEAIIFGKTATCLSGQHRLLALIFAAQAWEQGIDLGRGKASDSVKEHWHSLWEEEPVIESVVVFGVDEDESVVRTFDCTKPRTMADVFYTTNVFGQKEKKSVISRKTKMLDYAVRLVWDRIGAKNDAYSPYRTLSEVTEFVKRHPRTARAVNEMYKMWVGIIDGSNKIKVDGKEVRQPPPEWMLTFGKAAGFMYLMAASMSDGDAYHKAELMSEELIDFKAKPPLTKGSGAHDVWDKAGEFWLLLQSKQPTVRAVIKVMEDIVSSGKSLTDRDKMAVLTLGWLNYRDAKPVTEKSCMPEYEEVKDDEGNVYMQLKDFPLLGGIDCGGKPTESEVIDRTEPTEEEKEALEAEAEAIKQEAMAAKKDQPKPAPKPAAKTEELLSEEDKKLIEQRKAAATKPTPGKTPLKGGIGK